MSNAKIVVPCLGFRFSKSEELRMAKAKEEAVAFMNKHFKQKKTNKLFKYYYHYE